MPDTNTKQHSAGLKKSQVSSEFIILLGVIFLSLLIFLYATSDDIKLLVFEKEMHTIRDVGFAAQNELFFAANANDGYYREFTVPEKYNGIDYSITIMGKNLIITSSDNNIEQDFLIPEVQGNIQKGLNNISRERGVIYLN